MKLTQNLGSANGQSVGSYIYGVKIGPVSKNIYYLEWIPSPKILIARKTSFNDTSIWITSYSSPT